MTSSGGLTSIPILTATTKSSGSFAHLASGRNWETTITLINTGGTPANAQLRFFDDAGKPLSIPFDFQDGSEIITVASLNRTLAAHSALNIITRESGRPLQVGSAVMTTDGSVNGFVIFRSSQNQHETLVEMENREAGSYVLPFDNSNGAFTDISVANVGGFQTNVSVIVRNDAGTEIETGTVALPANGHISFQLVDRFATSGNERGTVEFVVPSSGQISVVGLKFTLTGDLTSVPTFIW